MSQTSRPPASLPQGLLAIDSSGAAAAAALHIAHDLYEKLLPLRPPADATPEHLAKSLTTQARQVGYLAWEILHALQTPRQP